MAPFGHGLANVSTEKCELFGRFLQDYPQSSLFQHPTMKPSLSRIGPQLLDQHFHIRKHHSCFYWGEYTPWSKTRGANADYSETNRLIADLKIPNEQRANADEWTRKIVAIEKIGEQFAAVWKWHELLPQAFLVPVPSSRRRDDTRFDARMELVVEAIARHSNLPLSCGPLLLSDGTLEPSHAEEARPKLTQLAKSLSINEAILPKTQPKLIFLFDDVLTTGAHFVSCSALLKKTFPDAKIVGNFVARTCRPRHI